MGLKKFPYCTFRWLSGAIIMLLLGVGDLYGFAIKDTTIFGGPVSGYWSADYEYNILSDIEILSGDELIIEAGAQISFNENTRLDVKGKLTAIGEEGNFITFKKTDQKGKWYGIHVLDNAVAPRFEYCNFENTRKDNATGTIGALSINSNDVPIIRYCVFTDNEGGAINLNSFGTGEDLIIRNNEFKNIESFSIYINSGKSGGKIYIANNKFEGKEETTIGSFGIYLRGVDADLVDITGNTFKNFNIIDNSEISEAAVIDINEFNTVKEIKIKDNDISECKSVVFGALNVSATNFVYINSTSISNTTGLIGGAKVVSNNVNIERCLFSGIDNGILDGGGALYVELEGQSPELLVNNTEFENNQNYNGNGGAINIQSVQEVEDITIEYSVFKGNKANRGAAIFINSESFISSLNVTNTYSASNNESVLNGGFISIVGDQVDNINISDISSDEGVIKSAYGKGGVIDLQVSSIGDLDVSNCDIIKVESRSMAGFINLVSDVASTINIHDNKINEVEISGENTSAAFISIKSDILKDLKIESNSFGNSVVDGNGGIALVDCNSVNQMDRFSFSENTIGSSIAQQSGGVFYAETGKIDTLMVNSNNVTELASSQYKGGFGFIRVSNPLDKLTINDNTVQATFAFNEGGFLALEDLPEVDVVEILNNNFGNVTSREGNGGLVNFNNNISGEVVVEENQFSSVFSGFSGGLLNFDGELNCTFLIKGNVIDGSADCGKDGGFVNIVNRKDAEIGSLEIVDNSLGSASAENGIGGFVNLIGRFDGEVEISRNKINESVSANYDGGAISIDATGMLNDLLIEKNSVGSSFSDKSGGFAYVKADSLRVAKITGNEINTCEAKSGNGGFMNIEADILGENAGCIINDNVINNAISSSSGGAIAFNGAFNGDFEISDNSSSGSITATSNGGFSFLSFKKGSELGNITYTGNKLTNTLAQNGSGGTFYLYGKSAKSYVDSANVILGTSRCATSGGYSYINVSDSISKVVIDGNMINETSASINGGCFYIPTSFIRELSISENINGDNIALAGNGGFAYVECDSIETFRFTKNQVGDAIAEEKGGLLYFRSSYGKSICLNGNKSTGTAKSKEGGFIYIENIYSQLIDSLVFENNSISEAISLEKAGGALYYKGEGFKTLISQNNIIDRCSGSGNGGVLGVDINEILIGKFDQVIFKNEDLGNISSNGNGGYFDFPNVEIDSLVISGIKIQNTSADNNGGFLNIEIPRIIKVDISELLIDSASCGGFGGLINLSSSVEGEVSFTDSYLGSFISKNDGGLISIVNENPTLNKVLFSDVSVNSSISESGKGGIINLKAKAISEIIINNLNARDIVKAEGEGGGINIDITSCDSLAIIDGHLRSAKSNMSGGYVNVDANILGAVNIKNISGNDFTALSGNGGFCNIQSLILRNSIFEEVSVANATSMLGGFINYEGDFSQDFIVWNCGVSENSSSLNNGGFINFNNTNGISKPRIILYGNEVYNAESESGHGAFASLTSNYFNEVRLHKNESMGDLKSDLDGGAFYIFALDVENMSVLSNSSHGTVTSGKGAFVCADANLKSGILFTGNTVFNAEAGSDGGLLYIPSGKECKSVILQNNVGGAMNTGGKGSILYFESDFDTIQISNNRFRNFLAQGNGAGIYINPIEKELNRKLVIDNNSFIGGGNTNSNGGALFTSGLEDVYIINTQFQNLSVNQYGAGIYLDGAKSIRVDSSKFYGNLSDMDGGALCIMNVPVVDIHESDFIGNSGRDGGAVFVMNASDIIVDNSNYSSNRASGKGASFYTESAYVSFKGSNITYGSAVHNGGGIYLYNCDGEIDGCYVEGNNSKRNGGGIYFENDEAKAESNSEDIFNFTNSKVINNTALAGGGIYSKNVRGKYVNNHFSYNNTFKLDYLHGRGGAIYLDGYSLDADFYNCLFYSNNATGEDVGAGLHVQPRENDANNELNIVNCNIYNHNLYGIYFAGEGYNDILKIENSIVFNNNWDEKDQMNYNDAIEINYSNVQDIPDSLIDETNFSVYPSFIDNNDFNLFANSACIDAGNPNFSFNDVFFPPSQGELRNDVGATGGPFAFKESSSYLNPGQPTNEAAFRIVARNCHEIEFRLDQFEPDSINYQLYVTGDTLDITEQNFKYTFVEEGTYIVELYTSSITFVDTIPGKKRALSILELEVSGDQPVIDDMRICSIGDELDDDNQLNVECNGTAVVEKVTICVDVEKYLPIEGYSYEWKFEPEELMTVDKGQTSAEITIDNVCDLNGQEFTITYRLLNTCGFVDRSISFKIDTSFVTGIVEIKNIDKIKLFPNPISSNRFTVEISDDYTGAVDFSLFDINNRLIVGDRYTKESMLLRKDIDISGVAKGLYFGKVTIPGYKTEVIKLIIQ